MRPLGIYRPGNILQPSDFVCSVALTTSAQAFDMPAGAGFMEFSANANFAVAFGSTAAAWPTASSTAGTASEINPSRRAIGSTADTSGFSIIASTAGGVCSIAYYGKGGG